MVNDIKELMTCTLTQEEGSQEAGGFPSFLILSLERNEVTQMYRCAFAELV